MIRQKQEVQNPIQNWFFFSDIKRVYYIMITVGKVSQSRKILIICWSSRPQVFYKVVVLKNFAKFTGKHQRRSFLMNLLDGGLKPTIILKKRLRHRWKFANFEEHLFYRTFVADCFWISQNINNQKASVSANY